MHYKNGEREYKTDFSIQDQRQYFLVLDVNTGVEFYLPEHVILSMTYAFSWDRYHDDMDKTEVLNSLKDELRRLESLVSGSPNIEIGKNHILKFIKDMEE